MAHGIDPPGTNEPSRFEARFDAVDRTPVIATALVAALVCLAILKPWVGDSRPSGAAGSGRPGATAASSEAAGGPRRSPTPAPTSSGVAVIGLCHDPGSWRTATIETWRDQSVRVWRAIDPAAASGPLDPTIPIAPAVGTSIPAIGYCAPTGGGLQPIGPATVRAWRLEGAIAVALELRQVAPLGVVSPYGALFGPPAGSVSTGSWPDGTVVFRHAEVTTNTERWFAIEISGTSGEGSPAPSASGGPGAP